MKVHDSVHAQVRYSFAPQFLEAAVVFARKAAEIESSAGPDPSEILKVEHRGYVVSAIMQSVAALETEIHEIMVYGPGAHLGSNGTNIEERDYLKPCAEMIDHQQTIDRYKYVLHLLKRPPLPAGTQLLENIDLVIKLRNELVHHKSLWGEEMETKKFFKALKQKKHTRPPFYQGNYNFFPHICLSADCAKWAASSTIKFLDAFYKLLNVPSRLEPFSARLKL